MKQFQVPQFIDIEDKILGFVTMRQFFTMLIPLTVAIVLYFILDFFLMIIISVPTTIISAIFAFYRPNGMKFSKFIRSFLSYTFKPRLYVWKREEKSMSSQEMEITESERIKKLDGLKK
ncbi:MAG: PrgI family protein [Patescibacteria group bacterium]